MLLAWCKNTSDTDCIKCVFCFLGGYPAVVKFFIHSRLCKQTRNSLKEHWDHQSQINSDYYFPTSLPRAENFVWCSEALQLVTMQLFTNVSCGAVCKHGDHINPMYYYQLIKKSFYSSVSSSFVKLSREKFALLMVPEAHLYFQYASVGNCLARASLRDGISISSQALFMGCITTMAIKNWSVPHIHRERGKMQVFSSQMER